MKEKTLFIIMLVLLSILSTFVVQLYLENKELKKDVAEKQAEIVQKDKDIEEVTRLVKKFTSEVTCIKNPFK
ncbi:hypothetical protein BegalDRAFT_1462 [Beggiatoa alba B18LD]|uniref:Uncharacterized protein n=1 Tax=Beggiatoa alba B18LD TaxID=395493 RepID=I3CFF7_9GAMM|nr:hypothetical protein [Beggiatoa alba]EIJ42350.1 hypothetical protein BegalDRAFT_1462 [Beggiatoa alba B18LD]